MQLVHQIADLPARVCACSETQERYGLAVPARLTEKVLKIYNEDFALPALYAGACACISKPVAAAVLRAALQGV